MTCDPNFTLWLGNLGSTQFGSTVFIESKTLENKDERGDYDTVEGTDI